MVLMGHHCRLTLDVDRSLTRTYMSLHPRVIMSQCTYSVVRRAWGAFIRFWRPPRGRRESIDHLIAQRQAP